MSFKVTWLKEYRSNSLEWHIHEVLHNLALVSLFNEPLISYSLLSSWSYSQAPLPPPPQNNTHSRFKLTEPSAAPRPNHASS